MIQQLVVAFVVAALAALAVTPLVIRLAHRVKAVDQPGERKIHTKPIPRLGGVAVCAAFILTTAVFFLTRSNLVTPPWETSFQGFALFVTCLLVLALGTWDDIVQLGPGRKVLLQTAIGTLVYISGIRITSIAQPLVPGILELG